MTVQEIMKWAYMDSGEPSDLCPYTDPSDEATFDITRTESQRLLTLINAAYRRIANWRFRSGRQLYHQNLFCREYISIRAPITSAVIDATANTITLAGLSTNTVDMFKKWTVRVTAGLGLGEEKQILYNVVDTGNALCTLDSDWEEVPDASSTVELVRSFARFVSPASTAPIDAYNIRIDPISTLQDILKIRDVDTSSDLSRVDNVDAFTASYRTPGVPAQYKRFGQELWFDTTIESNRTYELLFIRQPEALTTAAQIPVILEPFHQAIVLWAVHDIMRRNQDLTGAYATKRELEDLMEMTYVQGSAEMMMEQGGITIYG